MIIFLSSTLLLIKILSKEIFNLNISQRLIELRNQKGLTQQQVAESLDVKRARYNAWEQGLSQPNIEMIQKLSDFHNVSTDYLLGKSSMKNAEVDRKVTMDESFRVIQRAAQEMSPEQREKAIEMWDIMFRQVVDEAKKQEGVKEIEGSNPKKG